MGYIYPHILYIYTTTRHRINSWELEWDILLGIFFETESLELGHCYSWSYPVFRSLDSLVAHCYWSPKELIKKPVPTFCLQILKHCSLLIGPSLYRELQLQVHLWRPCRVWDIPKEGWGGNWLLSSTMSALITYFCIIIDKWKLGEMKLFAVYNFTINFSY